MIYLTKNKRFFHALLFAFLAIGSQAVLAMNDNKEEINKEDNKKEEEKAYIEDDKEDEETSCNENTEKQHVTIRLVTLMCLNKDGHAASISFICLRHRNNAEITNHEQQNNNTNYKQENYPVRLSKGNKEETIIFDKKLFEDESNREVINQQVNQKIEEIFNKENKEDDSESSEE